MAKAQGKIMWALGWLSCNGKLWPRIIDEGAWKLFRTREEAVAGRSDPWQDLRRVRVVVLPAKAPAGKRA